MFDPRNSTWNGGGLQFRTESMEDESGVCSPPLWGNKSPTHPTQNNKLLNLSQQSRIQAIARGQKELMEMVKAMPESSYELSLKDLVDYHSLRGVGEKENQGETEKCLSKKGSVKRQESLKNVEKRGKMVRSGSNINENKGLLLKMVFPIMPFGGNKKKKKANPYSKVSPKPDANTDNNNNNKGLKVVEKEWWKRKSSVSDESESGGISSNSGSTGSSDSSISSRSTRRSNSSRKKSGCLRGFSPFRSKKSKSAK